MEDLPICPDAPPTLFETDRFLTIARHAPGATAVHGGRGGLGAAATLIVVHLISGHGFPSKAAIAWMRMIHPTALLTAHGTFLRTHEAGAGRRRQFSHTFSVRTGGADSEAAAAALAAVTEEEGGVPSLGSASLAHWRNSVGVAGGTAAGIL